MAIRITADPFDGYPNGDKVMRRFKTGEIVTDVLPEYEQVLITKGFAVSEPQPSPIISETASDPAGDSASPATPKKGKTT